jgi:hypothetical protein
VRIADITHTASKAADGQTRARRAVVGGAAGHTRPNPSAAVTPARDIANSEPWADSTAARGGRWIGGTYMKCAQLHTYLDTYIRGRFNILHFLRSNVI